MKAMVVYDSFYGNTEKIARAIGDALGPQEEVAILRAGDVEPEQLAGVALLVAGSPTRRFSPTPAINALLRGVPKNGLQGVKVAAFDTRFPESEIERVRILAFFVRLFGYAAEPIAERLEKKGGEPIIPPEGFLVEGVEGPLAEGELERAADWARRILAAR